MTQPMRTTGQVQRRSPFAGRAVHELVGLPLKPDAPTPLFDDEVWDLHGLEGTPTQLWPATLRFDFTAIRHEPWRWVGRELMIALLAPGNDRVELLPLAYRDPLAPQTCRGRLLALTGWLNWLTDQGVTSLHDVDQHHCDRYLHHHSRRGLRASSLVAMVLAVKDLARYQPLFTADRYTAGFEPWPGRTPTGIGGYRRSGENITPPVPDHILRPALHAALYLVEAIAPHLAAEAAQLRRQRTQSHGKRRPRSDQMREYFAQQIRSGQPLPELDAQHIQDRLRSGWDPNDPLLRVSFGPMTRQLGSDQPSPAQLGDIRDVAESAVRQVGILPPYARDAALVARADGNGEVPWTTPVSALHLDQMLAVTVDACLLVTAAISGMRSSELMELTPASCVPPRQVEDDQLRFTLQSKRVKGATFGGTVDEWTVIEPAYRAVELAARLNPVPADQPVFGRFSFVTKFDTLRRWVNSPAGQSLGLASIPDGRVTAKMLRRTLALELAHRPNGLFAAKLALKHISVVTSEVYAARPGGAQARFHAEVADAEAKHRQQLAVDAFRDYQAGILPAGPGARGLIASFEHVDAQLAQTPTQPVVVGTDRQIELLLAKRAGALHVQAANYCWFTDPAKALCLKLANTPEATAPIAGLCDATRCPQATFHPEHRDVWATCADTTKAFLGNPRVPQGEKTRLAAEHDRALRVIQAIDSATTNPKDST